MCSIWTRLYQLFAIALCIGKALAIKEGQESITGACLYYIPDGNYRQKT